MVNKGSNPLYIFKVSKPTAERAEEIMKGLHMGGSSQAWMILICGFLYPYA